MLLSLLTGVFGKYIIGAGIILLLVGAAFGYLKYEEHEAAQKALIAFNQSQLAESIKENPAQAGLRVTV